MNVSMNFHPDGEWQSVKAEMWGEGCGCCIQFWVIDESGKRINPIFHLASWKNRNTVLRMWKEAINSIPEYCDSCGQEIKPK